ncbi:MAG: DinB family protein [Candidatus Halalkalibacterium sp. M3_1C_030]
MKSRKESSYDFYINQFEKAKTEVEDFILPLDDRTFRRKPDSKTWCIGECYSHLVETGTSYYQKASEGVEEADKPGHYSKDPMHIRFFMQWFINYLEPPITLKSKAPGPFKPVTYAQLDKDEVLKNFLELQDKYITLLEIADTNNLDLSGIKVSNPLISFIKMTVAESIAATEAHQRRHIEQARMVKKRLEENL